MKFFRQRSSDSQTKLSFYGINNKTVGSFDEIVKKLRQALNKSSFNNNINTNSRTDGESDEKKKCDKNCINANNAETSNENRIKQYLENLRQKIILNKMHSDSTRSTAPTTAPTTNGGQKAATNCNEPVVNDIETNNSKLMSSSVDELYSSDILLELILKLPLIGFENKKLIANIVCNALLLQIDDRLPTVEYISKEPEILFSLIDNYKLGRSDLTLNCGRILRQCIQHQSLAQIALNSKQFYQLFSYVDQQTFDVSMDAFLTFRLLLTTHKQLTEDYLSANSVSFFDNYIELVKSDNYVTKRQSLEILALILGQSLVICKLFSNDCKYMKVVFSLFSHKYRHIRFRALNVFNVLINYESQQSIGIMEFLLMQTNRQRLLEVLNGFRDCKTKCKFFLDLKPFAAKLILFFDETNQTQ